MLPVGETQVEIATVALSQPDTNMMSSYQCLPEEATAGNIDNELQSNKQDKDVDSYPGMVILLEMLLFILCVIKLPVKQTLNWTGLYFLCMCKN